MLISRKVSIKWGSCPSLTGSGVFRNRAGRCRMEPFPPVLSTFNQGLVFLSPEQSQALILTFTESFVLCPNSPKH